MALNKLIEQLKSELQSTNIKASKITGAIKLLQDGPEVRQTRTKRMMSPETIEKIRASQTKRWADKTKAPESVKGN